MELFFIDYNLDQGKKTVAIMPHIFCDAPHAYPSTLYSDYYEWFIETAKILKQNSNINVMVKEHPSAHLYNEKGVMEERLKDNNINITVIDSEENTYSIIQNTDVIVTCGGTIGLEFACTGKPVILAANPPYSNLGFTIDNKTIKDYTHSLLNCHLLHDLNEKQKENAFLTAYLSYDSNKVNVKKLEIGSKGVYLGQKYNDEELYNDIINYQKVNISNQYIYKYLESFVINNNRLGLDL